jgi:hypothetical protein
MATQRNTVVAVFSDLAEAKEPLRALYQAGFSREDVSLLAPASEEEYEEYVGAPPPPPDQHPEIAQAEAMSEGGKVGATLGGITGLILGIVFLAVPGVGPIVVGGPLAAAFVWAGAGAAAGGIVGGLGEIGVEAEHASLYEVALRQGGCLIVVQTQSGEAGKARDILQSYKPLQLETRAYQDDRDLQPLSEGESASTAPAERDQGGTSI